MNKKVLTEIGTSIVNANSIEEEIKSAELLSDFFSHYANSVDEQDAYQTNNQDIIVPGGIALSQSEAAVCTKDYLRTARYIKGIFHAIKELFYHFPNQKINILYAGCGPFATLLTPLLPLFRKEDITVILLDINEASVRSVKSLLSQLKLMDYITEIIQTNAITYQKPLSWPMHLLVSETMFRALTLEPQVAITANLLPQLIENGILIPEQISVDLSCSFFSNEPFYKTNGNITGKQQRDQQRIDTLFSIDKSFAFFKSATKDHQFESAYYKVPADYDHYPDLCLYTTINIFKNIKLESAESFITNPYCITSISTIADHTFIKLIYNFKDVPNWTYELKK